jgi:CxxC motif-containing protein
MFQVLVACSSCPEEIEVLVEDLEDVEREACPCGYSYVVLAVSEFEPVYATQAQVIQLPRRRKLSNAA